MPGYYYVIGAIILIVILFIVGTIIKQRMFDSVDKYESWKVDVINRNIAAELSRVKGLNLQGETKKLFEQWKDEWDTILMKDLATVEEFLYDSEKAIDRFQFASAKRHMQQIHLILSESEKKLDQIIHQLNELIETEAANRTTIENLTPEIEALRRKLSQNRFKYERADARFEDAFNELDNQLLLYNDMVKKGNYVQAKQLLETVAEKYEALQVEFEEFPELYKLCKYTLPSKLDKLYEGIQEMKEAGYSVRHLQFEKEISDFQLRLIDCVIALEKEGTEQVRKIVPDVSERIEEMYDLLEKEVIAKNFIQSKLPNYKESLETIQVYFLNTRSEIDSLKRSYHFEDEDLEKYLSLEKMIDQLKLQLNELMTNVKENKQAHTKIRFELENGFNELENIEKELSTFQATMNNLRKDEIEAREQLHVINEEVQKTYRTLRTSNLPGIPNHIWTMLDEATEKNERVLHVLERQPLDMGEVQQALANSKDAVKNAIENTNLMLEQARLTEQVIQYANRYRSSYPILAGKLLESERLFRSSEYELALEQAASAVEEVEPGALKRIERFQEAVN